ncbi:hypothetical protein WA538_003338 [Blastocystis sp. DL]
MSYHTRIADYFFVASVTVDKSNLEQENPDPVVLDRFPEEDYEDLPFTENAEFFCLPEGARIEHREAERRKPYVFTFCFTQSDGSQSYGTSLVFYELLKIDGEECYNKYNQELYVPKALCILSLKPFFSCHTAFLKALFRKAVISDDQNDDISEMISESETRRFTLSRASSFSQRRSVRAAPLSQSPIERDIRYYVEALPFYTPGVALTVPVAGSRVELRCPPANCLPFCDPLCLRALLQCMSLRHVETILCTLLTDGKVLMHSRNKYQLTLCGTALLALLAPLRYALTFIPLLPAPLIDYIEAPTPFLVGLFSDTFSLHSLRADETLIVHLDYDKITFPAGVVAAVPELPFADLFDETPPLAYSVVDTDRPDSRNARFVRFTVTAGPGPLGAAFRQEWRAIEAPAGIPRMERVTVLDANRADFRHGVLGPHVSHNALLSQSPAVLQVNEVPVVGVSLKRVAMTMASAPRPMTLLMQVGCPGQSSLSLDSRGGDAVEDSFQYFEEIRIRFFLFFVMLFRDLPRFLSESGFDVAGFVGSQPASWRRFAEEFAGTQVFEGLRMALADRTAGKAPRSAAEAEAREVWSLLEQCAEVLREEGEDEEALRRGAERIRGYLHPRNWKLKMVTLTGVETAPWMSEVPRDGSVFPRLEKKLFGEKMVRMEV